MDVETFGGVDAPIFDEPWEVELEANHVILIGGMAAFDEEFMARSYKAAGDMLCEHALDSGDRSWEVSAPIVFLYRHTIELYLKMVVHPAGRNHDIAALVSDANAIAKRCVGQEFPAWATARLREFADFDPRGTAFRYADSAKPFDECMVDLRYLRQMVTILTVGLGKLAKMLRQEQGSER